MDSVSFLFFFIHRFAYAKTDLQKLFAYQQRFSCHFSRLLHTHHLDQSRSDVCQASAFMQCIVLVIIYQNDAREFAAQTMDEVRKAMRIDYFSDAAYIEEQAAKYKV